MTDTIFARATGAGRAALAILRLSGPEAGKALHALAGSLPAPRQASVRTLRDREGQTLDQALVLWMPGPDSFTGEDCAELHVHGGSAVIDGVSRALAAAGARQAEPGEFSRRAFAHGKLDLLQAEAISDLVDAETDAQRRQALGQLEGGVSQAYQGWRARIVQALALIEAELDFPDEDLPGAVSRQARPILESLRDELARALGTAARGRQVRDGYRVALIGAPNAGKSSLLNSLAGREAAIVSSRPGTTRDIIEVRLLLGGFAVTLADTAGLRDTSDEIEAEGVRRATAWAESAAIRLLLIDPAEPPAPEMLDGIASPGDFLVWTKADLRLPPASQLVEWDARAGLRQIQASATAHNGADDLLAELEARVRHDLGAAETPVATRARHERALGTAIEALGTALTRLDPAPDEAAEEVRRAASALESVVGRVDRETVLDEVFRGFCIGK